MYGVYINSEMRCNLKYSTQKTEQTHFEKERKLRMPLHTSTSCTLFFCNFKVGAAVTFIRILKHTNNMYIEQ